MQEEDFVAISMKERVSFAFVAAQLRRVLLLEASGCSLQHKGLLFVCFPGFRIGMVFFFRRVLKVT